ncbi:hypothetical protein RAA17_21450 [Komagataeibacter rhaeticus]|nr:hypothetical protein [Komagataeibacter rhaeticus]
MAAMLVSGMGTAALAQSTSPANANANANANARKPAMDMTARKGTPHPAPILPHPSTMPPMPPQQRRWSIWAT